MDTLVEILIEVAGGILELVLDLVVFPLFGKLKYLIGLRR